MIFFINLLRDLSDWFLGVHYYYVSYLVNKDDDKIFGFANMVLSGDLCIPGIQGEISEQLGSPIIIVSVSQITRKEHFHLIDFLQETYRKNKKQKVNALMGRGDKEV